MTSFSQNNFHKGCFAVHAQPHTRPSVIKNSFLYMWKVRHRVMPWLIGEVIGWKKGGSPGVLAPICLLSATDHMHLTLLLHLGVLKNDQEWNNWHYESVGTINALLGLFCWDHWRDLHIHLILATKNAVALCWKCSSPPSNAVKIKIASKDGMFRLEKGALQAKFLMVSLSTSILTSCVWPIDWKFSGTGTVFNVGKTPYKWKFHNTIKQQEWQE